MRLFCRTFGPLAIRFYWLREAFLANDSRHLAFALAPAVADPPREGYIYADLYAIPAGLFADVCLA